MYKYNLLSLLLLINIIIGPSSAVLKTWNVNSQDYSFHNDTCWTPVGTPGHSDRATINRNSPIGNIVLATQLVNVTDITIGPNPQNYLFLNSTMVSSTLTIYGNNFFLTNIKTQNDYVLVDTIENRGTLQTVGNFLSDAIIYNRANAVYNTKAISLAYAVSNAGYYYILETTYQMVMFINSYYMLAQDSTVILTGGDYAPDQVSKVGGVSDFNNTIVQTNAGFTITVGAQVNVFGNSQFAMITDRGSEKIFASGGEFNVQDSSFLLSTTNYFQLASSRNNFINSEFNMTNNAIFEVQDTSIANFTGSTLNLISGIVLVNITGKVYLQDSVVNGGDVVALLGNSYMEFSRTSMVTVTSTGMVSWNSSAVVFKDKSYFNLGGSYLIDHNSSLEIEDSTFLTQLQFIGGGGAKFSAKNSEIFSKGEILFYNNSTFTTSFTNLTINNQFGFFDHSSFLISDSLIYSQNAFSTDNYTVGTFVNSAIYTSRCVMRGDVNYHSSSLYILDQFVFGGGNVIVNQTSIYLNRQENDDYTLLMAYGSTFHLTNNSNIIIVTGSIYVMNSSFIAENSNIEIQAGSFIYFPGSKVSIKNSTFVNNNGQVLSNTDIYVYGGSSISNSASFILSSNIYPGEADPLLKIKNYLSGRFDVTADHSDIQVDVENLGEFEIKRDASISKYTQNSGRLTLNGGLVNSNQSIDILGGSLQGNGTIGASIVNGGVIGTSSNTSNFNIIGNYTQSENGETILTVFSAEQYSSLNISEIANLDGNLTIRVSSDVTQLNITLVSYASASGDYRGVNVKVFNPKDGSDVNYNKCNYDTKKSGTSLSMLVGTDKCGSGGSKNISNKLSNGAIAGIVVGGVVAAAIAVGIVLHFTNKIPKSMSLAHKLKSLQREVDAAEADKA